MSADDDSARNTTLRDAWNRVKCPQGSATLVLPRGRKLGGSAWQEERGLCRRAKHASDLTLQSRDHLIWPKGLQRGVMLTSQPSTKREGQ